MKNFLIAACLAFSTLAQAQTYPERVVKIVVPFGAGGIADVTARVVAERLSERMGQKFIIENVPGAGGKNAARAVLSAPNDGHTLALLTNGTAISVGLFKELGFDPMKDFAPISNLGNFDFLLVTQNDAAYSDFNGFIAAAKAAPKTLSIGTINIGSTQNLTAQLIKNTAGIDVQIIPFRTSGEAIIGLIRKDVALVVDGLVAVKGGIGDGSLKSLGSSSLYDVTSWNALFAKSDTAPAILSKLNAEIQAVLGEESVKNRLKDIGIEAKGSTPQEIAARLAQDITRWGKVIEQASIEKQ
jgi:tripartite-type tricarboxylate transporter receptor subunit TctC